MIRPAAETNKKSPASILNQYASKVIAPPINAAGIDVAAKEKNNFLSKYPEDINLYDAIAATIIFNINEVDLISINGKDNNAITAKYPDAPACPTEE